MTAYYYSYSIPLKSLCFIVLQANGGGFAIGKPQTGKLQAGKPPAGKLPVRQFGPPVAQAGNPPVVHAEQPPAGKPPMVQGNNLPVVQAEKPAGKSPVIPTKKGTVTQKEELVSWRVNMISILVILALDAIFFWWP
jgi:hypothetical protein